MYADITDLVDVVGARKHYVVVICPNVRRFTVSFIALLFCTHGCVILSCKTTKQASVRHTVNLVGNLVTRPRNVGN